MTAPDPRRTILFLCTDNSARSILAEFLLNHRAPTLFQAYSAGSNPRGEVHPLALRVLREQFQIDPAGARSKSWDEYRDVRFDFVITLCDNARESCPIWPGQPVVLIGEVRTRRRWKEAKISAPALSPKWASKSPAASTSFGPSRSTSWTD